MLKVSEIISKPVISLYESDYQGIVYNIAINSKNRKCKYLYICDNNDIKKILDIKNVYTFGQDCILIGNSSNIELKSNYDEYISPYNNPINLDIYTTTGTYLGKCIDIILDDKFTIHSLILNNDKTLDHKEIINIGKNLILIKTNKINLSKFQPQNKIQNEKFPDEKVVILNEQKTNEILQENMNSKKQIMSSQKIITDYRFLIGRKLSQDIIATNGEKIANKDSRISNEIIKKASYYGKLLDVTRYSIK